MCVLGHFATGATKLSTDLVYTDEQPIRTTNDVDKNEENGMRGEVVDGNADYQNENKFSDQQRLLFNLMNSVPVNQRPAVSAVLRQRQAQRIRSKSMVHHNLTVQKEG